MKTGAWKIGKELWRAGLIAVLVAGYGTPSVFGQSSADLILHNGVIATVDDLFSLHSVLVVSGDRVVAVGGEELLGQYTAPRMVDLNGRLALPGFNDTHTHIGGTSIRHVDLAGSASIQEIKDRIRARAEALGPGEWVTGSAWSEDELVEARRPLRDDLDDAAPNNPVVITRAGSHSSVANTLALELAEVDENTPDPENGLIERGPDGRLNGVLREGPAMGLVSRMVPAATPEELRITFVESLRRQLEFGITSFIQAGTSPNGYLASWTEVYAQHGDELPRATVQIRTGSVEALRNFGLKTGDGDERLRVGALKVAVDGGYTGAAAYTLEGYADQPDFHGTLMIEEPELYQLVRGAHDLGWQMGFHTIGDGATVLAVDVFERVLRESPRTDHRHYLNHLTVPPPEETFRKMARNNILVAQQPNFVYTLEGRYVVHLDGFRLEYNNPVRLPQSYGIFVALGNDILPIDPRVALYGAVTRKGMSGRVFGPEDRISVPEAIRGYTRNGAYFTWEEDIKGSLVPGMLADIVILNENILEGDPERIRTVPIDMTIVGGRVLYERAMD